MRPLNLLFFLNTSAYGGVEEVVLRLMQRLDRARFNVHVAAPPALIEALRPQLEGYEAGMLPVTLLSWKDCGAMRQFVQYLRGNRIQIANSHMSRGTLMAAPLARLAGVPVVIETGHGPELWRKHWTFAVDRAVERLVDANISVSEAYRDFLVSVKGFPAGKIRVVPNGRDLGAYSRVNPEAISALRQRYSVGESARVIVHVGRLQREKGHRYLIEALPAVVKQYPDVRLFFVGEGPLEAELRAMAAGRGLERHIVFTGFTDQVQCFYQMAEMVVLPSLHEGMPLVAIEAGAARRPLVASAVDGTCEVILEGKTGLLVPPASPEPLARALLALLADPERARQMGEAARRRVEERFSLDRQVEETARVYEEAFRERNPDGRRSGQHRPGLFPQSDAVGQHRQAENCGRNDRPER